MTFRWLLAALSASLLSLSPAYAACNNYGPYTVATSTHTLSFETEPEALAVGQSFSLLIDVCDRDGSPFVGNLEVDAHMPAHRHGMNYAPEVKALGNGQFQADGFLFHMPGHWQFTFDLYRGGTAERILSDYTIK